MSDTRVTITVEATKKGISTFSKISYDLYIAMQPDTDLVKMSAESLIKKLNESVPDNDQKDSE